ncbi:hypothetical protein [Herbaspirillum aquaticum]|jgi:hypothetical protein|uniref:Integrase n=1 Tax=Herbaspirillum aquaticum TaxID=568783 RepID=A0A225SMK1_9BURK|nr:hypothetical protein [Herbaspirillum aquaticum]OWY31893.1 hypothetical protein CEJ45_23825 [Herbaspirillum aquaticum]
MNIRPRVIRHGDSANHNPATVHYRLKVVPDILTRAARFWRNDGGTPWLASAPLIEMLEKKNSRQLIQLAHHL